MRTGRRVRVGAAARGQDLLDVEYAEDAAFFVVPLGIGHAVAAHQPLCTPRRAPSGAPSHAARRTPHAPLYRVAPCEIARTSRESLRARRAARHCRVDAHLTRPRTHVFEVPQVRVHCGLQTSSTAALTRLRPAAARTAGDAAAEVTAGVTGTVLKQTRFARSPVSSSGEGWARTCMKVMVT
jgi:hypothetical protein